MLRASGNNHKLKGGRGDGMRKKIAIGMIVAVACLFFAGASTPRWRYDQDRGKDCPSTKGEIQFSHKKHSEDYTKQYADLYAKGCSECHHDAKGQPVKDLKADSKVDACIACHKKCARRQGQGCTQARQEGQA